MGLRWGPSSLLGVLCCLQCGGCMDPVDARAGADRTVAAGATVTMDGSRSLPSNPKRISYLWEVADGPQVTFADQRAAVTTFAAPSRQTESKITLRLTVTYIDLGGQPVPSNTDTDEVLIRVLADRDAEATADTTDQAADNAGESEENTAESAENSAGAEENAADDAAEPDLSSNGK